MMAPAPLAGRVALVTGVSRRIGIGPAIVRRLLDDGALVLAAGWSAHDAEQPWGDDPGGTVALLAALGGPASALHYVEADLADPSVPHALVELAVEHFGGIDIVVANHARSGSQSLSQLTVKELDACWAVNARGSILLAKALMEQRQGVRPGGRLVLFTSGQHLGPMPDELPYIVSKGAIHQMTASLSEALVDAGITVNCINPGPVDTGYLFGNEHTAVARMFPAGRWGEPDDAARLVAFLVSDEGAWITGQIINSEGGWRRHAHVAPITPD